MIRHKRLAMLGLGFSSGLPFMLVGNTFGYWLRDSGTSLAAIGFLSWVGLAYSLKLLWAPLLDRLPAPFLRDLGRRRGWMVFTQIWIGAGLLAMAALGTSDGLVGIGIAALVVAVSSATQDMAVDAWRIEVASDAKELALLTSAYQFGYRGALLTADALILISAEHLGWQISYGLCGLLMGVGLIGVRLADEPVRAGAVMDKKSATTVRSIVDAVIGPFVEFFRTHGWASLIILAMISLYRLPEYIMGPMYNPYYHDLGLTKDMVGAVRSSVGLASSLLGIGAAGFIGLRLGYFRTLILGAVIQSLCIASFGLMAFFGPDLYLFSAIMAVDTFAYAFAGVALVTYMSTLTSLGYTATQYALLSSTYALLGKVLKGFSGAAVEGLTPTFGLLPAYAFCFAGAAAIGIPTLILCAILARRARLLSL